MLELPFGDPSPSELDELVKQIDDALDRCFLGDVAEALEAADQARKAGGREEAAAVGA